MNISPNAKHYPYNHSSRSQGSLRYHGKIISAIDGKKIIVFLRNFLGVGYDKR